MPILIRIRQYASTLCNELAEEFNESQLLTVASSLAYTTLLSLIPVLAVSFAIFQAFGGLDRLYSTIEPFILANLAEGSSEEVIEHLRRFIGNVHGGAIGAGGFVGLLITSISLLFSIEKAINRIWKAPNTRPWFNRLSSYWFFITLGPLALSIGVGFLTSEAMPLHHILPTGTGLFVLAGIILFWLFKVVPNRVVHWKPALLSAVLTSIAWNVGRILYQIYTAKLVSYNKIYGSLGAIPILLLWIYIMWVIVLSGVVLTSVFQKRFGIR
jgi:membrane protein